MTDLLQFRNLSRFSFLTHCITTKRFGSIDNFNLATYTGSGTPIENRKILCNALNLNPTKLTIINQVHRADIFIVDDDKNHIGNGIKLTLPAVQADAIITTLKDVPIMVFSADCPLVILFDPNVKLLALIHSSWRAILGGIIESTIKILQERFSVVPFDIIIGIGPGAGRCCYEVDQKFIDTISTDRVMSRHIVRANSNKTTFDLHGTIREKLLQLGIPPENIESMDICTICDARFFSYRRDGPSTGRFSLISAMH